MSICIEHICKSYGDQQVLRDLSYDFPEGKITCILGPSGCGKTTLLNILSGLSFPYSGTISGLKDKKISAVFQEDRLFENLSAEKNVLLTARRGFARPDARALLKELDIAETAQAVHSFSGGMKRRTAIARALAAEYDLLLLDEPTSGLDGDTRSRTLDVIRRHAQGRTVICVTHDPANALRLEAGILRLS